MCVCVCRPAGRLCVCVCVCVCAAAAAAPDAFTLTVTDIATGWTENRSVADKAAKHVLVALNDIAYKMPFPILGVDSDNGSEFINVTLLQWCERQSGRPR